MNKIPASVGILTYNSASTLRRTLESVKDFDDIIVCDGGSTDDTVAIAESFGARVIAQDARYKNPDGTLKNYSGVRNQCLDAARHDWFLYIDSDETISDGLREDIVHIVSRPLRERSALAYRVPIGIMLDGRYIKYSSNYPGYQFRFFNRQSGARFVKPVHERIEFDQHRIHIGTLQHPWYVYTTQEDWDHYVRNSGEYKTTALAEAAQAPFGDYVRFTVLWHVRASVSVVIKAVRNYLLHGFDDSIPVRGELGRAVVPLVLIWKVTALRWSSDAVSPKKVYYVANERMPSEKAYGIQLAKMCEALVEQGVDLTLVVPRRGVHGGSLRNFYHLRTEVPTVWLPAISLRRYERVGYALMSLSFCISYTLYLWWRWLCGERFVLYTIDADRFSSSMLALAPAPLFTEMHGAKPHTVAQRLLFGHLQGVIAINRLIIKELQHTFVHSRARYLCEPNGVDLDMFRSQDRIGARQRLGLPEDVPMVLYTGRFFDWKGLEIVPKAAALTPNIRWQVVGGSREEFSRVVRETVPDNMQFVGSRPHGEMPLWLAAADAVVVLGTARDEQSYRWTSPMKLFEYLAAGKHIVASATPALKEIVTEHEALLYTPDDVVDLADKVRMAVAHTPENMARERRAAEAAKSHTWDGRARRVIEFVESITHEQIHRP